MDCRSCGHPNREGARFCAECGTPLGGPVVCASCGAANASSARFCDACGHPLATAPLPATPQHLAAKIRAGRAALEGERKQVTVLFADAVGSMELAERIGAETWRRLMAGFVSILGDGVHRFEGTVDKFTGDGIMALFGAPIAHEDHARRACHAALHLQRELAGFAADVQRAHGVRFAVRTGLNSGEVVVGAVGQDLAMAYTAVGHTVGLAQRMEQLARPGAVCVSQHTAALAEGYVELADLGQIEVKGASRPVRVYELTGVGTARGRLDVAQARGLGRFVGRDRELQALEDGLEQALAGDGQVVGIAGEAGVGKSRLCHEFAERRRAEGTPVFHVAGLPHARSVPLLPVLDLLRAYFGIGEHDPDAAARERISARLLGLDARFDEDLPLLFDFLGVSDPGRSLPRMDPEARQRRLLALMKRVARAQSAQEPGVTLVEDLHWLDPASELFLANQVEAVQGTRGLVVVNFRPEYRVPWAGLSFYRQIALAPLADEPLDELLTALLGDDPSLAEPARLIRERTGGNPFFVEELVRALVEAGSLVGERGAYRLAAPVTGATVPSSVQAVLAARIDRLAPRDKAVLQAAAVIGKEFAADVLERVVDLGRGDLDDALQALRAGEFVDQREPEPEALYAFRHPLTREVAYGSQLRERRGLVHAAVARAIAELYPERLNERAALVAQHWEAAGVPLEAAHWYARAAVWAGTGDPAQALRHWTKVRELADTLPDAPEYLSLRLTARMFAMQFGWRLGVSQDEARAAFEEAERLAVQLGDVRARAVLLNGYGAVRGVGQGDVREFARLQRRALALAEEFADPMLYMAIVPGAYAFFCTGDLREALASCDRALELADGDLSVGAGINYACPYAWCYGFKGVLVALLGDLAEAGRLIAQARRFAEQQGDLEVVGFCDLNSAYLAYFVGEPAAVLRHAQDALEIADQIGNAFSRTYARTFLGLARALRGEWPEAVAAHQSSIDIARAGGLGVEEESRLALLGEACLGAGDARRARALVEEALPMARERGNVWSEVLASTSWARVLLATAGPDDGVRIETELGRALGLARATGSKATEPLIRVELAELARRRGDDVGSARELRQAYRLFTEIGAGGHAARLEADHAASMH